ncbi:unnamed protein product [Lampetra fluviatilis]
MRFALGALVVVVMVAALGVEASHLRGGTISWIQEEGGKVRFNYMLAWRRTSKEGGTCTDADIDSGRLITSSSTWHCLEGCQGSYALSFVCTEQNEDSNWMIGASSFEFVVPASQPTVVSFDDCCWVKALVQRAGGLVESSQGSWSIITVLNPGVRSDTGAPNVSPVTASKPLIRLKAGCTTVWNIPVYDADGDTVRCRYAENGARDECGTICGVAPYGVLDEVGLPASSTSRPPWTPKASGPWPLVIEDSVNSSLTIGSASFAPGDALSSIPLQVLLEFETALSCAIPIFVGVTPASGASITAFQGVLFEMKIDVEVAANSASS